jgi:alpha-glucosidase
MLLMTLRGTPTMYYGDEIGMHDVAIPSESVRDPWEINVPGFGVGRDPERTPMQWDDSPHAGFTTGDPWLPVSSDYPDINVRGERNDPASMLTLYRRLIALRKAEPALTLGAYRRISTGGDTMLYMREDQERRLLIALNFSSDARQLSLAPAPNQSRILLSTHLDRQDESFDNHIDLRADEGIVAELL